MDGMPSSISPHVGVLERLLLNGRRPCGQEFGWNVKTFTVQKPMMGMTASLSADDKDAVHYIYVCVKGEVAKET